MKVRYTFIIILFSSISFGQDYFEGQVNFKKSYESMDSRFSEEILEKFYGGWMTGFLQENRYVVYAPLNENDTMKVFYFLETSDGFIETTNSDTIEYFRIDEQSDELISAELTSEKKIVLGDTCQSFRIEYLPKDGFPEKVEAIYYYNTNYGLNPEYYSNHKESFWNLYVKETKSISVRNEIISYPFYKTIYEATGIIEGKIDDSFFILSQNKVIKGEGSR